VQSQNVQSRGIWDFILFMMLLVKSFDVEIPPESMGNSFQGAVFRRHRPLRRSARSEGQTTSRVSSAAAEECRAAEAPTSAEGPSDLHTWNLPIYLSFSFRLFLFPKANRNAWIHPPTAK
jgi:hypothetical protein